MTYLEIAVLAMIFLAVVGMVYSVMLVFAPRATRSRLDQIVANEPVAPAGTEESGWKETVVKLSQPLAGLALPEDEWDKSPFRAKFMHAGLRSSSVPTIYFAIKTFLTLLLPALFLFFAGVGRLELTTQNVMMVLAILAAIGYYAPNIWLSRKVAYRQRELFENFPDAIDLMTVCVEAGLGLDAALAKVGEEIQVSSPVLAEEIQLVGLELRAGASREKALRDLAIRNGVEEIEALVGMLIQADRFGTSTAASLRVYSDELRTKRRLRAEEAAAKLSLKLLFPLIFFIFPSLMVVLLGPAFISIYRNLLPALSGQ